MRKASTTLKREIAARIAESGRPRLRRAYGVTFNTAVGDVLNDKPISLGRENWMREKLGMRPLCQRKRSRYWRPCLPLWLRDEIEKEGWSNKRITDELYVTLLVERMEKEP